MRPPLPRCRPSLRRAAGAARLPAHLQNLAERARDYVEASSSANTRRAYAADWRHFCGLVRGARASPRCRRTHKSSASTSPPAPPARSPGQSRTRSRPSSGGSSSLTWNFAQRGQPLDRNDRHIATVLAGIRRTHGRPPEQKEAILPEDLIAMIATLDRRRPARPARPRHPADRLRRRPAALRNRRPRLSAREQTEDGTGWIEILDKGVLVTLRGKTGWREVEIGRGSSRRHLPRRRAADLVEIRPDRAWAAVPPRHRQGKTVGAERLTDKHVARLVKRAALAAGVRGDLSEGEREQKFSGHSLRAGLASSAEVDERYVQKQLGHASAEMTRRYQRRRDRFRVNLTKAAGL